MTNGVKRGGVDVAWTLILCFWGVRQDWMSSVFEMSNVFWIAVLSLFSSWYDIIVRVELVVYDVWCAEDDNTGFLSVGVDIFDRLSWKNNQFPCPWCQQVLWPQNMVNKYYVIIIDENRYMWINLMNNQNIMLEISLPYKTSSKKSKLRTNMFWWMLWPE